MYRREGLFSETREHTRTLLERAMRPSRICVGLTPTHAPSFDTFPDPTVASSDEYTKWERWHSSVFSDSERNPLGEFYSYLAQQIERTGFTLMLCADVA
jgi:hypothetical protein